MLFCCCYLFMSVQLNKYCKLTGGSIPPLHLKESLSVSRRLFLAIFSAVLQKKKGQTVFYWFNSFNGLPVLCHCLPFCRAQSQNVNMRLHSSKITMHGMHIHRSGHFLHMITHNTSQVHDHKNRMLIRQKCSTHICLVGCSCSVL